jgi:hypothetical protein
VYRAQSAVACRVGLGSREGGDGGRKGGLLLLLLLLLPPLLLLLPPPLIGEAQSHWEAGRPYSKASDMSFEQGLARNLQLSRENLRQVGPCSPCLPGSAAKYPM